MGCWFSAREASAPRRFGEDASERCRPPRAQARVRGRLPRRKSIPHPPPGEAQRARPRPPRPVQEKQKKETEAEERGGFEPPVRALDPYNGLANRRLRP